jgi:hypothetical protein
MKNAAVVTRSPAPQTLAGEWTDEMAEAFPDDNGNETAWSSTVVDGVVTITSFLGHVATLVEVVG